MCTAVLTNLPDQKVTLEINSTEDPEGFAFGYVLFATWAAFVGGVAGGAAAAGDVGVADCAS